MSEQITTDILILGTGGAGLMAALHAHWRDPAVDVTLVSKGLLGKSGCTRMVQGGYNVVLNPKDSIQAHFEDTVRGGAFLNDQELAWTLRELFSNWKIASGACLIARRTGEFTRKRSPDKRLIGQSTRAI